MIKVQSVKKIFVLIILILAAAQAGQAKIQLGMRFGRRTVFDEAIRDTYGSGSVYLPFLRLTSRRSPLGLEIAYEGGYKKSANIGLFDEVGTLRLWGVEAAAFLTRRFGPVVPYVKLGIGYYAYSQEIESEFVRLPVDHKQQKLLVGGGVDVLLPGGLFLSGEFKYVPLKVAPHGVPVDLSGYRILVGMGIGFDVPWGRRVREVE
jgi:hypothetical protein